MAVVKFNREDEFIQELIREFAPKAPIPVYNIVRLTNLLKTIPNLAPLRHLYVVATIKVRGDIIRLDRYCGDIWNIEREDKPVWEKADAVHKAIEKACQDLALEVRAGVFEET